MKRILLAEDEEVLRMLIVDTLEDEDYEVDEAADGIDVDGAAVEPVIDDIVGQPAMLQDAGQHMVPGAVKAGQPYQHEGQERAHIERQHDRRGIDRQIRATKIALGCSCSGT